MTARAAKLTSLPTRKTAVAQLVAQLFVGGMALGAAMPASAASCTWNPAAGNWAAIGNWLTCATGNGNPAGTPGAADSASIAAAKTVTINTGQSILTLSNAGTINIDAFGLSLVGGGGTTNTGTINVGGPTTANIGIAGGHNINNTGGTINIANGSVVNQFGSTITGGTIATAGTGALVVFGNNTLSGVTLNGTLDAAANTVTQHIQNGLTLNNGTVKIDNNSLVNLEGTQTIAGTGGSFVFGATGNNRLGVDGGGITTTLGANVTVSGVNGTIGVGQLINGSGNTLVNQGLISSDSGGTISLAGAALTNQNVVQATGVGSVLRLDTVVDNTGGTLRSTAGGVVLQNGVTVTGGNITNSGGGTYQVSGSGSNYLSGVTLTSGSTIDMATAQATGRIINGMTVNGTVNINNSSLLNFEGDQTLSGNGSIVFGATGNNRVGVDGGGKTLTIDTTVTIRGENGTIGLGQLVNGSGNGIVNKGTISANVAGGTVVIAGLDAGITNNGTISALNGGTIALQSNLIGGIGGQLVAGAGSVISQQGVTISGVVNTSGGGSLRPTGSGSNFLSGVTLNGNLDMATAQATERVINNLALNGAININNGSLLNFEGNQTLSGSGSIVFGATGNNRVGVDGGGKTLTVANGVTIRGENGTIGVGQLVNGSGNTLVNQGLISSDSGGTISLAGAAFVNQSTAQATGAGSVLRLDTAVDNTGGTLRSTAGGVVLQNGVSVTGGNITNSGGATYQLSNSGSNILSGVTLTSGSTIDMASAQATGRAINGMTVNGTVNINNNSLLNFEGNQTLAGTGSIVFGATGNNRVGVDGGGKTLTIASGTTISGVNGSIGLGQLVNGSGNAIVNNGTINSNGGGTIAIAGLDAGLTNNGLLRAQNGTLNVSTALSGSGTLQVDATGVMNLANGAKTQGTLAMGATGAALNLGTGNLTINTDYTNVGAGTGNAFNRRAGVTGAGLIVAGGDAAQAITGSGVTNGNTTNATLTLGNMRVGSNTSNYQVADTGTTGPSLRGAIQTAVNGGNITDARLSGAGVTASNYNTGAPGSNTGNLGVTFTAATAGTLAPLSGQLLNLRSNFENVPDQKLNIVLSAGAAAYNVAQPTALPANVSLGNFRAGTAQSQTVTLTNTNISPAGFQEGLNATIGTLTGAATGTGALNNVAAGSSGSLQIGVTGVAGSNSGSVQVQLASNGTGTSGLGNLNLVGGLQTITVSGAGYRLAGADTIGAVAFGNVHVGDSVSQALSVRNNAVNDGFSEKLNASFGGTTDARITTSGTFSMLGAGATNASSLIVGLNTSAAGNVNGTARVLLTSDGFGTSGLGQTALTAQDVGVSGNITTSGSVFRLASASPVTPNPVSFGNVRVGAATDQALTLTNTAANDGFSEKLNASIGGATTGVTSNNGAFTLLAAQASNSTSLRVGLDTASAGAKSGSATITLASDGTGTSGLGVTPLTPPTQTVTITGAVYREAATATTSVTPAITLAARVGGAASGNITVTNNSVDGFTEGLNVTRVSTAAGFTSSGGPITNLAANASSSAIGIALNTATAGTFSGSQVLALASNGAITGSANDNTLANVNVTLNGKVYTTAVGQVSPTTTTVDFGIVRVNDIVGTKNVTVQNTANVTALNDSLRGTLTVAGPFTTVSNSVSGIGAGATGNIAVGLNTSTAGISNQTGSVSMLSQDGDLLDASAGANASVQFKAQVNNLANAHFGLSSGVGVLTQSGNVFTLDLGNIFLNSSRALTLKLDNFIGGPADDLSGGMFNLGGVNDFTLNGFGSVGTLAAGQIFSGNLNVSYLASALGMFTDTVGFDGFSTNTSDPAGIGQHRTLVINANVINAGNTVPEPGTLALLLMAAAAAALAGRRRTMAH